MILPIDITTALSTLFPGAKWAFYGPVTYENLTWLDEEIAKPSKAALDAEIARLQAEYDAKQYQRNRAAEYPSIADQLDKIFHGGIDEWKETIQAVKDKYPKS
jgi:predicted lipoprotein